MVIGFSVKEARDQLLNEGVVYTYRWERRTFFRKQLGEKEHTWANSGRRTKSIGDVWVEEIGQMEADEETLEQYASDSGFWNVAGWCSIIIDLGWQYAKEKGWLYKVTLQDSSRSKTK